MHSRVPPITRSSADIHLCPKSTALRPDAVESEQEEMGIQGVAVLYRGTRTTHHHRQIRFPGPQVWDRPPESHLPSSFSCS